MIDRLRNILSGFLIALGAFAYISVGGPLGALLFSFGICSIVGLNIKLYTGVAGTDTKFKEKLLVLFYNIIGAAVGAGILMLSVNNDSFFETSRNIVSTKLTTPFYISFFKAIACGLIVDISVHLSKVHKKFLPLLIGIPTFILCGFNHSIADAAYFVYAPIFKGQVIEFLVYYSLCIIGNYIGCNFRRICKIDLLKVKEKV